MLTQQDIRDQLPQHLRQFVAEQDYATRYTARDQAVWRYVLRQLVFHLSERAHPVYFEGLTKTGITLEHIPSIDEMNVCLAHLGWRAIVVDGFIPPQAFMELQALRVLAIALDMRSIDHIEYTPAPDIIHEAAGHAPIIADEEYSEYLQRFGEVGMKAIYNLWDVSVYEAVRTLSIVKECSSSSAQDIEQAELKLEQLIESPGDPSELALLTRLHWWTVEYGLVGSVDKCNIFGAGLLSSLSESQHCLGEGVEKVPLTTDAILTSYDITRAQPQLFVTKSCRHLTQVLDEYAATMCYQKGGAESVQAAMDAQVVTTCEYSSGLQVSGHFTRLLRNAIGVEIYIATEGATQLSVANQELEGQGLEFHPRGFSSPVGRICNLMKPLEDATEYDLQTAGIKRESRVCLVFLSGITVEGWLSGIEKQNGQLVLFNFNDCTVTGPKGERLFEPEWGVYDMAVGERIISVYAGSADREKYDAYPAKSNKSLKPQSDTPELLAEFDLYARVRRLRESTGSATIELLEEMQKTCPKAWLLYVELLELCKENKGLFAKTSAHLDELGRDSDTISALIRRGREVNGQGIIDSLAEH